MTAGLHRDFLQMGVTNGLVRPGGVTMLGSPVDLSLVDRDSYLVAGVTDHICPWTSCYRSTQLLGGSKRFVLSTSGHIAAMVNPPGNEKARYRWLRSARKTRRNGSGARTTAADPGGPTTWPGWPNAAARRKPPPTSSAAGGWRRYAARREHIYMTIDPPPTEPAGTSRRWSGLLRVITARPRRAGLGEHVRTLSIGGRTVRVAVREGNPDWPSLLSGLLDQLGYEQVDVLGISWGGGLAQQFAASRPARVRRPVLINARIMHWLVPRSELHIYHGGHLELAMDAERMAPIVEAFLTADRSPG
jgi:alpha/beta hydrolase fold